MWRGAAKWSAQPLAFRSRLVADFRDRRGTAGPDHSHEETPMPAKSKAQQKAAGAALSAKRGETPVSELQGASKEMYDSMSEDELEDFAATSHNDLPDRVEGDD